MPEQAGERLINGCQFSTREIRISINRDAVRISALEVSTLDSVLDNWLDADPIPYWAALWPSALALAATLGSIQDWCGVHVLELGCGPGLVGIALASLGARVTMTDLFPQSLALARENSLQNNLRGIQFVAADWHTWPLDGCWPVIVGSDLIYERHSHSALLSVLERALAPNGTVYLADPDRPMSGGFLALSEGRGWRLEMEELRIPGSHTGYLYRMQKPDSW